MSCIAMERRWNDDAIYLGPTTVIDDERVDIFFHHRSAININEIEGDHSSLAWVSGIAR